MRLIVAGAGLMSAMLMMVAHTAYADVPPAAASTPQVAASSPATTQAPALVPADFTVPTLVKTAKFRIVPLGPDLTARDFAAYMSSIEHLQTTFSRSTRWPRAGISQAEALEDMQGEQARFAARKSFAYSVLTPDGTRERGCVYVSPSPVPGYDAMVRIWVTQRDYDAGFDAELYRWVVGWVRADWPFANVAYPGRAIAWTTWDPMVAASKAAKATENKPRS